MALNLNVSPYYDDSYEPLSGAIVNNYNRILFRPGYAVQARELTALQTILQDQIGRFGDHVFKNGSVVQGCEFKLDSSRAFVKIRDAGVINDTLASYVGDTVTGATSGITAVILDVATGTQSDQPNLKTLYLRYTSGDGSTTAVHFTGGETLTVTASVDPLTGLNTDRIGKTFVVDTTYDEAEPTNSYWGIASALTVDDGIVFIDGKFVSHASQTIVLSKYSNLPTVKVGFQIVETTVSPEDDPELLDPANGSFNFAAPGADRYQVTTTLVAYEPTDVIPSTFNQLVDIVNGEIQRTYTANIYGELGKNMARRTYDESGNYAVRQFPVLIKEHLNVDGNNGLRELNAVDPERGGSKDLLAIGLEAGKVYVRGFEHETFQTEYVVVPKGLTTVNQQEVPISTAYGNYILVNEFCGLWDLNGGDRVSLRSAAQGAVTDGTFSAATAAGSEVGTARVKQIVYESGTVGTAAAEYRLYLYDINMSSADFKDVRGIFYNDAAADGHADVVLTGGDAILQETSFNSSLFKIPARATKTIKPTGSYDNSFIYTKEFDGELSATGGVTVTLSGDETFPYDAFTSTIKNNNFVMVLKEAATIDSVLRPIGSNIDLTSATFTKNSATSISIDLVGNVTSAPKQVKLYVNVQTANANPVRKVLRENRYVVINTNTHPSTSGGTYSLGLSDVYRIKNIFIGANTDTDAAVIAAGVDVASSFTLDNGQRDNEYRNAKIIKQPSAPSLVNKKLVIKLDYFTHDGASADGTFFVIDSYPIDDTGATPASIKTQDIPIYASPITGKSYDLRDTLDFRVRLVDTATQAVNGNTPYDTNPTEGTSVSAPAIGVTNPVPTEQFITDIEYYLGRTDRLTIDSEGIFSSIYGSPSLTPLTPAEPENAMSLAIISIPPYPSLAPNVAKSVNRPDYGVSFRTVDNRRYTMRDIGVLEQRINRLEYYTSLSLLEKAASDLSIPDGAGLDRFKNGILVDAFTGHNVGNVFDSAYHISIDPSKKEMRPFFYLENIDLAFDYDNSTNVYKTGDLITLPYVNIEMTSNPSASKPRNCVGELLFNYIGNMELDPPVDNWTDTSQQPDVSVNFDGNYDAWETMADAWGTQWGSWQDTVTGRTAVGQSSETVAGNTTLRGDTLLQQQTQVVTTTIEQRQTRQGVSLSVTPETQTQRTGARVTNTSIIPFMRSVTVTFIAQRMKPNTRVYPFFDGVGVAPHCRPLSVPAFDPSTNLRPSDPSAYSSFASGDYGDPLITNAQGVCVGQFRIPAATFRTGDKNFRLCDDQFNRDAFITTASTKTWSANGLSQNVQDTVISTRVANVERTTVSDSRSVFETERTENRIADRTVGTIETTVNNTFTTVNNITNIDNTVTNTTVVNETNITTIVQDPPVISSDPPAPPVVLPVETPTPDPCAPVTTCWEEATFLVEGARGRSSFGGLSSIDGLPSFGSFEEITTPAGCNTVSPCAPRFVGRDPIAQTFYVEGMPFGCYVTNLDVYFRTKSSSAPITLQLREVINGYPGNKVIPFGEVTLNPADVSVSETAATATTFTFPSPVHLQNNTEYCFVLLPAGNNPDYNIWVSELGENELGTQNRISEQPHVGVLFTSANNRSWTAWQKEDIKFTLRRADFEINSVGSLVMKNLNMDYLKFDSFSDGNFEAGDAIHGFSFDITNPGSGYTDGTITHTLSGGGATTNATVAVTIASGAVTDVAVINPGAGYTTTTGTLAATVAVSGTAGQFTCGASRLVVGDTITITGTRAGTGTITGYTSGTIYKVSAVTGTSPNVTGFTLTTQSGTAIVTTAGTLTGLTYAVTSNPRLTISSGSGSAAAVTVTLNKGFAKQYDTLYNVGKVLITDGSFTANDIVGNGSTYAEITEIEDKQLNVLETNMGCIDHTPATISWSVAPTATGASGGGTTFEGFNFAQEYELSYEAQVYSYSNEQADLDGDKSLTVRAGLLTQTSTVSPVIDTRKCSIIAIANDINNVTTNEDGNNGSAASKYISRRVVLDDGQDAEDLKVYLSNKIPTGCDVKVYGRFQNATDASNFDDLDWIELELTNSPLDSASRSGFVEYQYTIPTANKNAGVLEYTVGSATFAGYKTFAVKVVPLSTNSSVVPKIRELRAIALQV